MLIEKHKNATEQDKPSLIGLSGLDCASQVEYVLEKRLPIHGLGEREYQQEAWLDFI